MKLNAPLIWVLAVVVVSAGVFVHLVRSEGPVSEPVIKAAWFEGPEALTGEIARAISAAVENNSAFWIGLEPEKPEQFEILAGLAGELRQKKPSLKIIVDEELNLPAETLNRLGNPESVSVKNNVPLIGEKLAVLESAKTPYLLVTASVYSNSFIKADPMNLMRAGHGLNPLTFSMAYFPLDPKDERNMLFGCDTEDHSGTSDWGCVVVNAARTVRRKSGKPGDKTWLGLLNLSGEKNYILLVKRK